MRKLLCLVLVLLCVFSAAGCSKVSVSENASAKVVYDYNGISFSEVPSGGALQPALGG